MKKTEREGGREGSKGRKGEREREPSLERWSVFNLKTERNPDCGYYKQRRHKIPSVKFGPRFLS